MSVTTIQVEDSGENRGQASTGSPPPMTSNYTSDYRDTYSTEF